MNKPIKSLTLSIDEIRQLVELTDPEARRQVVQALVDGVENPTEIIDESSFADAHPMARRIAGKISRRAKAAARRLAKKTAKRESKKPESQPKPKIEFHSDNTVMIELNDATVNRLLWLKQNHRLWCKAIRCVVGSMMGSELPRQIHNQLSDLIDSIFHYIDPLISQAADYRRLPKAHRPRYAAA